MKRNINFQRLFRLESFEALLPAIKKVNGPAEKVEVVKVFFTSIINISFFKDIFMVQGFLLKKKNVNKINPAHKRQWIS